MADDGNRPDAPAPAGADARPTELPDGFAGAWSVIRRHGRGLYGFTLFVSAATAVLAVAILAAGFGAAWGAFEDIRDYADRNIANEDSYYAYADGGMESLWGPGLLVMALALVLALVVVSVLHAGYAVADAHARTEGGPLTAAGIWRRVRRRLLAAVGVNALTGLVMGAFTLALLMWFDLVQRDRIPGVERTGIGETATPQYALLGWILPITVGALGSVLYYRLAAATAEVVVERRNPFVALGRSWKLTRHARWRLLGTGVLLNAGTVLFYVVITFLAQPVVHGAGLGMLAISGDNVWITGVLVLVAPTVVALLLLPPLIMPLVCGVPARFHGTARTREEAAQAAPAADQPV